MVNKRKLHHTYVRLQKIHPLVIALFVAITLLFSALSLRNNNLQMLELRNQVFAADKQGEGVKEALNELRQYVYGHMGTDLSSGNNPIKPPIQLKYTYERLVEAEKDRVATVNQAVTAQATKTCEAQFPAGQIQARARCVQDYITANSVEAKTISKELYQFDFVSPVWSPDTAGFSLLLSATLAALLLVRIIVGLWMKHQV